MTPRMLLRIAIALVVVILLWGALAIVRRPARDASGGFGLPHVPVTDLARIDIRVNGDSTVIVPDGAAWRVNGFPAATAAVTAFLATLDDSLARNELVSESPSSHEQLGVDSLHGRRFVLTTTSGPALDLWVGSRGPDFEGFYVRRAGTAPVYLLRGPFAEAMMQPAEQWRDRQVARVPADSIGRIEVTLGRQAWALVRDGDGWRAPAGAADSLKAARFVAQFGDIRAVGFPEATGPAPDFGGTERRVRVLDRAGQELLGLELDSIPSGSFWARRASDSVVYRIEGRVADLLAPEATSVRP